MEAPFIIIVGEPYLISTVARVALVNIMLHAILQACKLQTVHLLGSQRRKSWMSS